MLVFLVEKPPVPMAANMWHTASNQSMPPASSRTVRITDMPR